MSKPDTPFPKHWRYYIVLKWAVIAAAIVLALKLFGVFSDYGTGAAQTRVAAVSWRGYAYAGGDLCCRHRGADRRGLQRGAAAGLGGCGRRRSAIRQAAGWRTHADRYIAEFARW